MAHMMMMMMMMNQINSDERLTKFITAQNARLTA